MKTPSFIIFDIETIPNERADEYYDKKIYEAPKNYSKPEAIAAYVEKAKAADRQKAALSWWTSQVVCIGYVEFYDGKMQGKPGMFYNTRLDEKSVLSDFFDYCCHRSELGLIGKSSKDFDIPVLKGRAMFHNIGLPPQMIYPAQGMTDIDQIFGYSRSCNQVTSLNNYAFGIGLTGKIGVGTQVADWVKAGLWDKITEYCGHDIMLTGEILTRGLKPFSMSTDLPDF